MEGEGIRSDTFAKNSSGRQCPRALRHQSIARNLISGEIGASTDVFVHDRQTGQTTKVSVSSAGDQANSTSVEPEISADGRFVAPRSFASNLDTAITNSAYDVFVRDLQSRRTVRVSVDSSGGEGDADGRFVASRSAAASLVAGDTNNAADIFATLNPPLTRSPLQRDGTHHLRDPLWRPANGYLGSRRDPGPGAATTWSGAWIAPTR